MADKDTWVFEAENGDENLLEQAAQEDILSEDSQAHTEKTETSSVLDDTGEVSSFVDEEQEQSNDLDDVETALDDSFAFDFDSSDESQTEIKEPKQEKVESQPAVEEDVADDFGFDFDDVSLESSMSTENTSEDNAVLSDAEEDEFADFGDVSLEEPNQEETQELAVEEPKPAKAKSIAEEFEAFDDDVVTETVTEKETEEPAVSASEDTEDSFADDFDFDFDDTAPAASDEEKMADDFEVEIDEGLDVALSDDADKSGEDNFDSGLDVLEDSEDPVVGDVFEAAGAENLVLARDKQQEAMVSTDISDHEARTDLEKFYRNVMETLLASEDLDVEASAKDQIRSVVDSNKLPQLAMRELVQQRVLDRSQLARATARTLGRREIMSFIDVPPEAMGLRHEMDALVLSELRENRVIPISQKLNERSLSELHLADDSVTPNLVLEATLKDLLPGYRFVWHYALREVCGAFWLSGESDDVDSGMEAEALLDRVIQTAIDARSSDIHIDPSVKGEPRAFVKYRIDGVVTPKEVITLEQLDRLRVRIENVARMPKVNLNHPNKGAFTRAGYDWRVQIQPHAGRAGPVPRVVIRRLQPDVMPMEALGYPEYFINDIKSAASASNGVVFWTGPTGSGKTESIHSAVVSVNPMGKGMSVHTIEDPPEKRVSGYAVQMEISEGDSSRSGLELLKSSLRADPDVVIFGEVRDGEMAKLVFEAANTGHLVFTTLHTNTALDSIIRLDELGIYGFMLSYVRGVASQRLVRRLCTHCRQKMTKVDDFTRYVFDKYEIDLEDSDKLYTANPDGCASCNFTGYHGRIAICEWLVPNREVIEISQKREYEGLEEAARRAGWKPMAYMGVLHVKNGITDAAELASKVLELSTTKK